LSRPSTPAMLHHVIHVDGRDKHGHDDAERSTRTKFGIRSRFGQAALFRGR
jgi:hypothetical protein